MRTAVLIVITISWAPPPPPARKGTIRIMGITHKSWNTSIPTASRPCGASSSPRVERPRRTTAVLDTATTQPRNTADPPVSPNQLAKMAVHARVSATWIPPPSSTAFHIRRKTIEGEFQPDPEEQEDDTDFSENLDLMRITHKAKCRGPGQDARQDESCNRRERPGDAILPPPQPRRPATMTSSLR